jgi:hypothetical protein
VKNYYQKKRVSFLRCLLLYYTEFSEGFVVILKAVFYQKPGRIWPEKNNSNLKTWNPIIF